jgi:hypothetical protein
MSLAVKTYLLPVRNNLNNDQQTNYISHHISITHEYQNESDVVYFATILNPFIIGMLQEGFTCAFEVVLLVEWSE